MQQILNSQERNQAFLKFLIFFIITVALLLVAIFFNFKIPSRENEWLQGQLENQQIQDANQSRFLEKMNEAVALLDSLNGKNVNVDLINGKLSKTLSDMQDLEGNEKTLYGKMNKAIVGKFSELKNARKSIDEDAQTIATQNKTISALTTQIQLAGLIPNRPAGPTQ